MYWGCGGTVAPTTARQVWEHPNPGDTPLGLSCPRRLETPSKNARSEQKDSALISTGRNTIINSILWHLITPLLSAAFAEYDPTNLLHVQTYLQGAVYSWIKDRRAQVFALRDLVGGANFDWSGTPLLALYKKHIHLGKTEPQAIRAAGRDAGWILKGVLQSDQRFFEIVRNARAAGYQWL